MVEAFPDVMLVGSKVALTYLKSLAQRPFAEKPVKCVAVATVKLLGMTRLQSLVHSASQLWSSVDRYHRPVPASIHGPDTLAASPDMAPE